MAEGDGAIYNTFKELVMEGRYDLVADTVKVILVTGHTPNIDTHISYGQVSGDEESGTGYSAGGETLGEPAALCSPFSSPSTCSISLSRASICRLSLIVSTALSARPS